MGACLITHATRFFRASLASCAFSAYLYTIDSLSLNTLIGVSTHASSAYFSSVIPILCVSRLDQIRTATRFVWYFFVLGSRSVHTIAILPKAILVN